MFGLKKCKEEDFFKFTYSNLMYNPFDLNGRILGGMLCNVIFFGIASFYLTQSHIECPKFLSYGIKIFILIDIILFVLCTVNNKKYAFKY
ncbi:MAG: hypothetical protein ACI398_07015 [Clostridium sp.]